MRPSAALFRRLLSASERQPTQSLTQGTCRQPWNRYPAYQFIDLRSSLTTRDAHYALWLCKELLRAKDYVSWISDGQRVCLSVRNHTEVYCEDSGRTGRRIETEIVCCVHRCSTVRDCGTKQSACCDPVGGMQMGARLLRRLRWSSCDPKLVQAIILPT